MPVTGADRVRANMRRILNDIEKTKARQFVSTVLSIGLNESKEYAPIEYSTLVNSAMMKIDVGQHGVTGTLSYNASYAAALEFGDWRPRAITDKAGPATNMNATPHYLKKGFESDQSRRAIDRAAEIFRV